MASIQQQYPQQPPSPHGNYGYCPPPPTQSNQSYYAPHAQAPPSYGQAPPPQAQAPPPMYGSYYGNYYSPPPQQPFNFPGFVNPFSYTNSGSHTGTGNYNNSSGQRNGPGTIKFANIGSS